jgi:hypothetical protein
MFSRMRDTFRLTSLALLLASTFVGAHEAGAQVSHVGFAPPAAQVYASFNQEGNNYSEVVHDVSLFRPECGSERVRWYELENQGGSAAAHAGIGDEHWARASATDVGGVAAEATVWLRITDPKDRATVKLDVTYKAHASANGFVEGESNYSNGMWHIYVGYLSRTPMATLWDNVSRCWPKNADWISDLILSPEVLHAWGYEQKEFDLATGEFKTHSGAWQFMYGESLGESTQSDDPVTVTIEVGTERSAVLTVQASASHGGEAAIDPIVVPNPENPEVIVEVVGVPAERTGRRPYDGISAEDLAARGIDPQPFINLGLVLPTAPQDAVPPSTTATASPGPNANGWNREMVSVALDATDNEGGSGVKEIRFAMSGATTGSEEVVQGSTATVQVSSEGETTVTYFAVDNAGNAEEAQTLTVRIDMTPPLLGGLPSAGCALRPPDHRLVQVAMVTASDARSGLAAGAPTVTATSSEPEVGTEAGDHAPDVVISGGAVKVRAERAGAGPGRVYTITASANDRAGNLARVTATCTVPHDRGKNK